MGLLLNIFSSAGEWLYTTLNILYVFTTVSIIIVIIMENRNPVKSLAWVVVLVCFPFVGIIFYLFFGQNYRKKRMISRKGRQELKKTDEMITTDIHSLPISDTAKQTVYCAQTLDNAPYYSGNQVRIFTNGKEKFDVLLQDLKAAQSYVHLQYYIIENDNIGRRIKRALLDCAHRGVQVRILYDDVGCRSIKKQFFKDMEAAGIEIHPFLKVSFSRVASRINYRNHRKICVIDGEIGYIGGMNIAEKRIPLDGRFGMTIDGVNLDVRVSTIPTVYGEKCVIRLLSTADEKTRKITDLGMTLYNYEMFKQIIRCPHGVMLVTGPTGSGKSTTLYATLGELSKPNVNIVTVEDPCEKKIDGVNQVQINAKAGLTFAAALRSILRQDPDIVMVGEIRDGETADIAIRAAITGHLVLSTLHTNDAASTILRLVDMGVAPYMVASSLVGVIAQRLVKLLCPECKEKVMLTDPADLRLVGKTEPVEICKAHYGGCRSCHNTGYKGRTAIHEIIVSSNDIKELISSGATAEQIGAQAEKNGTKLLRSNVTDMVLAGTTTLDELVKATYSV